MGELRICPANSTPAVRRRPGRRSGGVRYLFDCGELSDASLAGIVVQPEEIAEHRVVDLRTALTMLRKPIRLRVRAERSAAAAPTRHTERPAGNAATR